MKIKRLTLKKSKKLNSVDLGWIAGFFEGEGYAGCYKKKGMPIRYFLKANISQRDPSPILWLQKTLGFGSVTKRRGGYANSMVWYWDCSAANARLFLNLILPYFHSKYKIKQTIRALKLDQKYTHPGNSQENHKCAKLTNRNVKKIKILLRLGIKQTVIAKKYKVSKSLINHISTDRLWRNI